VKAEGDRDRTRVVMTRGSVFPLSGVDPSNPTGKSPTGSDVVVSRPVEWREPGLDPADDMVLLQQLNIPAESLGLILGIAIATSVSGSPRQRES